MSRPNRKQRRETIHRRIRKRVEGTPERPRLAVHRSLSHIYVQAIDDAAGVTIAQASTGDKELREALKTGGDIAAAKSVGQLIAKRLKALGRARVVFDRGGYLYHGRIKALADAARESGLEF